MKSLAEKSRSRSRLGADTARVWARELCLGNPYAKSVLLAVANYMNEDGAAWPGISTISRDTDISEDTVIGRLRWLENIGAIALFKCWVDEHGRRNYDGRGRVTSNEIRFLFDADLEVVEANAQGDKKPTVLRGAALESHEAKAEASPRQQREPDEIREQGVSTGLAPEQLPTPAARTEELKPDTPLPPNSSGDPAAEHPPPESEFPYERFAEAYGEGSVRPQRARTLWEALTDSERKIAIRGARCYRVQRLSSKKALIDPERFLRNRELWIEFGNRAAALPGERELVATATVEGRAWRCLWKLTGLSPPPVQSGGQTCYSVPSPMPQQLLVLAACVDDGGNEVGQWCDVEPGSSEVGAWRELISKTISRGLAVRSDDRRARVPAPFPPRVDGSWPELNSCLQKTG